MNWPLFGSIFSVVFLAELPDKTALAVLLMASRGRPLAVFLGVSLAYVVQTIVAVTAGKLFSLLPPSVIHVGAALVFIIFAAVMWFRKEEHAEGMPLEQGESRKVFWKVLRASFLVIFIAEWGDLTQLATVTFQAKYNATFTVFTASVLALISASGLIVAIGHHSKKVLNPKLLQKIGAVAFLIIGLAMLYPIVFGKHG